MQRKMGFFTCKVEAHTSKSETKEWAERLQGDKHQVFELLARGHRLEEGGDTLLPALEGLAEADHPCRLLRQSAQ